MEKPEHCWETRAFSPPEITGCAVLASLFRIPRQSILKTSEVSAALRLCARLTWREHEGHCHFENQGPG